MPIVFGRWRKDILIVSIEQVKSFSVDYFIKTQPIANFKHSQDTNRSGNIIVMPNRGQKIVVKRTPVGARGRRSARLDSAAERPLPAPSPTDEQDAGSNTSRASSEASRTACVATNSPPQALLKKRAKKIFTTSEDTPTFSYFSIYTVGRTSIWYTADFSGFPTYKAWLLSVAKSTRGLFLFKIFQIVVFSSQFLCCCSNWILLFYQLPNCLLFFHRQFSGLHVG